MATIDLNADLGEDCGSDEVLLALVSSAGIACGAHAGSEETMRRTIDVAVTRGVSIGAHPGYADRDGFGRRETGATPAAIRDSILRQLETFARVCAAAGATFTHVKPHGALYNRAMRDLAAAESIAAAVSDFDRSLAVLCMPDSSLRQAAQARALRAVNEAFLDRAYASGSTLVDRSDPSAVITDPLAAAARAERMVLSHSVTAADGVEHALVAESLCVHGDNPDAVAVLRAVRERLESAGVTIEPFQTS